VSEVQGAGFVLLQARFSKGPVGLAWQEEELDATYIYADEPVGNVCLWHSCF
jgi:hypothetical protein